MKTILILLSITLNLFSQSSRADEWDHITPAFGYWLQAPSLLQAKQVELGDALESFCALSPYAADRILTNNESNWKIERIANFDSMSGAAAPSTYSKIEINNKGEELKLLVDGYYFVTYGKDAGSDSADRLIITPSGGVLFRDDHQWLADLFQTEYMQYANEKNFYRGGALEFKGCFGFLKNLGELNVKWEDLILDDETKELSFENTENFMNRVDQLAKLGVAKKRGMVLEGPPGTGKSLVGQILISSTVKKRFTENTPTLFMVTSRVLNEKYIVQRLFQAANTITHPIIFIEDIDLMGTSIRDDNSSYYYRNDDYLEIMNEFLNGIDGVIDNSKALVIGTTNRAKTLDPALIRSERLGIHIHFGYPLFPERKQFFERFGHRKVEWEAGLTTEYLAGITEGMSGADIIEAIRLAKEAAFDENSWSGEKLFLTKKHFDNAITKVMESVHSADTFVEKTKKSVNELLSSLFQWNDSIDEAAISVSSNDRSLSDAMRDLYVTESRISK